MFRCARAAARAARRDGHALEIARLCVTSRVKGVLAAPEGAQRGDVRELLPITWGVFSMQQKVCVFVLPLTQQQRSLGTRSTLWRPLK